VTATGVAAAFSPSAVAAHIGAEVAGPSSDDVDRNARFPIEAVDAFRAGRLLGALVPVSLGGEGSTLSEIAAAVRTLAPHCASAAMVFAMHQIQVACLVRHGHQPAQRDYLRRLCAEQLLLASATTEVSVGGDVRTSVCAVERTPWGIRLEKQAPVISYGRHADGILATARRGPDSPPSDQVLVICRPPGITLEQTSGWDTLGFRGTCSLGFRLVAEGTEDDVLPDSYGDISSQTMLPVSHILWSSLWLGLAEAAAARAHHYVRGQARKAPGTTPPSALRLAELAGLLEQFRELVGGAERRYGRDQGDPAALSSIGFALAMNTLKVQASTLVVDVVNRALTICGMAGYRDDSPHSMGRLLRDAHGAALMINNDRILSNSAKLLAVAKEL